VELTLCQSDLFSALDQRFDVIVSNPPYIPSGEISGLMPEVRDHEPAMALAAGEDGLLFYRNIIAESRDFLREKGSLFFEIGCDQGEAVAELMRAGGYTDVTVGKDLAGLDRVVHGVC
jgi:release factor glutamine methyltransferase